MVDLALDISDVVLTTLRNAASVSTIAYFKEAAELVLGIRNVVRTTKGNRKGFSRLATDACDLVYTILCMHPDQNVLQPRDLDNVQELLKELADIERFAKREGSRNLFLRLIRYKSDQKKIQEYRNSLRQSLDVFGLKSHISIQENISRLATDQAELVADLQERKQREAWERNSRERLTAGQEAKVTEFQGGNGATRSPHDQDTMTSISGDHITTDASQHIRNTNSGNTTTTTVTNSNNDSSFQNFGAGSRGPRRRT